MVIAVELSCSMVMLRGDPFGAKRVEDIHYKLSLKSDCYNTASCVLTCIPVSKVTIVCSLELAPIPIAVEADTVNV